MIDLIGREATHLVGSRVSTIVGSCRSKDAFNQRLCQAQLTGLTRLEVSIYSDTENRYNPILPGVKTLWHIKMQCALDELAAGVLNNKKVMSKTYRKLNVPMLLASLVRSDINVLAIGRRQSWMINARTPDRWHFTGTKINYGYDAVLNNYQNWQRLEEQVRRYASSNATTKVYILSPVGMRMKEVCYVSKSPNAPV